MCHKVLSFRPRLEEGAGPVGAVSFSSPQRCSVAPTNEVKEEVGLTFSGKVAARVENEEYLHGQFRFIRPAIRWKERGGASRSYDRYLQLGQVNTGMNDVKDATETT